MTRDYSWLPLDEQHGAELWSTDGSITNMNADVMPGRRGSDPQYLTVYNDLLYFSAAGPLEMNGASADT